MDAYDSFILQGFEEHLPSMACCCLSMRRTPRESSLGPCPWSVTSPLRALASYFRKWPISDDVGARRPRLCLQTGCALLNLPDSVSLSVTREGELLPAPRFPSLFLSLLDPKPLMRGYRESLGDLFGRLVSQGLRPTSCHSALLVQSFARPRGLHTQPHCRSPLFTAVWNVKWTFCSHKGLGESKVGLEKESSLETQK